jgi:hypothetical protein
MVLKDYTIMNRKLHLIQGAVIAGLLAASMGAVAGPYASSTLNGGPKAPGQVSSAEMSRNHARQATTEAADEATRSILLETKIDLELRLKDHTSEIVASR